MTKLPDELALAIAEGMPKAPEQTTETATTETAATETAATETTAAATTQAAETTTTTETTASAEATTEVAEEEAVAEDYLKGLFPESEPAKPVANAAAPVADAPVADEPKATDPRIEALEKALQDPKVLWILEQHNKGLDPIEQLSKISNNDPSKYKSIDLYKLQIEEMRTSEGFTDEQVEEYIEDFQAKNPIEQANLVAAYRDKLNNEYKSTRESLRPTINAEEAQRQYQEQQDAIQNKALEELSSWKVDAKGKDFYGLEWTEERINRVESVLKSPDAIVVTKPDGTIDVPTSVRINATELYLRDILKTAITKTKNVTMKEALAKRHNTSPDTLGRQPSTQQKTSMEVWLDSKS